MAVWNKDTKTYHRGFLYDAQFTVMADAVENEHFFAGWPKGEFTLGSVREDTFEPGLYYYVDFTPTGEESEQ